MNAIFINMEIFNINKYGLKSIVYWLDYRDDMINTAKSFNCDMIRINMCRHEIKNNLAYKKNKYTRVFDLNQFNGTESLGLLMNKHIRNSVTRCAKEKINFGVFCDANFEVFKNKYFNNLVEMYSTMYKQKQLKLDVKAFTNDLKSYIGSNKAFVTYAVKDDTILVWHFYVIKEEEAILHYSCSLKSNESNHKKIVGFANRALHYNDFLSLKNYGIKIYNWGGLFSLDAVDGIDSFKCSFPGNNITLFDYVIPISLKGKIFCFFKKMFK